MNLVNNIQKMQKDIEHCLESVLQKHGHQVGESYLWHLPPDVEIHSAGYRIASFGYNRISRQHVMFTIENKALPFASVYEDALLPVCALLDTVLQS
jgi:hypothetical protein